MPSCRHAVSSARTLVIHDSTVGTRSAKFYRVRLPFTPDAAVESLHLVSPTLPDPRPHYWGAVLQAVHRGVWVRNAWGGWQQSAHPLPRLREVRVLLPPAAARGHSDFGCKREWQAEFADGGGASWWRRPGQHWRGSTDGDWLVFTRTD